MDTPNAFYSPYPFASIALEQSQEEKPMVPNLREPLDAETVYRVDLTNGTNMSGCVVYQDDQRIRLRLNDGFATTIPLSRIHALSDGDGSNQRVIQALPTDPGSKDYKTLALKTVHKVTIRKNPTTQLHLRAVEWPDQTFLLWFPEVVVPDVWAQWDAEVARQDFVTTEDGSLVWMRDLPGTAIVKATLTPRDHSVNLEVRVKAQPDHDIPMAVPQNCLHFSAAPDFACNDYSRIFVRVKKQWRSLLDLRTAPGAPTEQHPCSVIYREGFLKSSYGNIWKGRSEEGTMPGCVDHPLIACVSKSSDRTVATASEDCQGLFHNQQLPYLLCVHSSQTGVRIPKGEEAIFRQVIWFVDGGVEEAVAAFDRDVADKVLNP